MPDEDKNLGGSLVGYFSLKFWQVMTSRENALFFVGKVIIL